MKISRYHLSVVFLLNFGWKDNQGISCICASAPARTVQLNTGFKAIGKKAGPWIGADTVPMEAGIHGITVLEISVDQVVKL